MSAFRNSGAFQHSVIMALFLVTIILAESATAQALKPITDVKALVGRWTGTATSPRYNSPYELTVHEDGTWDSIVPNIPPGKFKGTLKVAGKKATAYSETTRITYNVALSERDGKETLVLTSGQIVIALTRAQ